MSRAPQDSIIWLKWEGDIDGCTSAVEPAALRSNRQYKVGDTIDMIRPNGEEVTFTITRAFGDEYIAELDR